MRCDNVTGLDGFLPFEGIWSMGYQYSLCRGRVTALFCIPPHDTCSQCVNPPSHVVSPRHSDGGVLDMSPGMVWSGLEFSTGMVRVCRGVPWGTLRHR